MRWRKTSASVRRSTQERCEPSADACVVPSRCLCALPAAGLCSSRLLLCCGCARAVQASASARTASTRTRVLPAVVLLAGDMALMDTAAADTEVSSLSTPAPCVLLSSFRLRCIFDATLRFAMLLCLLCCYAAMLLCSLRAPRMRRLKLRQRLVWRPSRCSARRRRRRCRILFGLRAAIPSGEQAIEERTEQQESWPAPSGAGLMISCGPLCCLRLCPRFSVCLFALACFCACFVSLRLTRLQLQRVLLELAVDTVVPLEAAAMAAAVEATATVRLAAAFPR